MIIMNIRKQVKIGKKMSMRPRKLKGLKVRKRIKAIKKMSVGKRLRRIGSTKISGKWISIVRKKIWSSRPKFPHYHNKKGRKSSSTTNNKNMIIIHNNTSITGNEELDNRSSCVDDLKINVTSESSSIHSDPRHQASKEDDDDDVNEDEDEDKDEQQQQHDTNIIKAAIHIQSFFRGRLARRAYRALRSLVRLQAMVRGVCVRRQARIALDCMNAMLRLQFRVRTRQLLLNSPANDGVDHPSLD